MFFEEWGLPFIRVNFPEVADRVAAGIFRTSQSIGADDELSHDHEWGPGFELILTESDYARLGEDIDKSMNESAPKEWAGWESTYARSVTVDSIDGFFEKEAGHSQPPPEWKIPENVESHLSFVKNGALFYDPLGEFSARRGLFGTLPEDELRDRLNSCSWRMWHYGDYNFVDRVSGRDDPTAALLCLGMFLDAAMRLCLYLNGEFAPYWKWVPYRFRKVEWAGEWIDHVDAIPKAKSVEEQVEHVKEIYRLADEKLKERGTSMKEQVSG